MNRETTGDTVGHAAASGPVDTGNSLVGDVWVNLKRWNRKAIRNPTPVILEVLTATFSLLLFTAVFGEVGAFALEAGGYGGTDYVTFLLPAVFMQATMGSAFRSGIGLVRDLETGMFEKVVVTPMSWTAVFAGKAAADLLRILVPLFVLFGLSIVLGTAIQTGFAGAIAILLISLLVGLLFMAISNVIGLLTRDDEAVNAATMLFMFPLIFLSPAFLPLAALSDEVELLATFNPVTYGVDAIRALLLDRDVMTVIEVSRFGGVLDTLVPAVGVLLVLNLLFGSLSVLALYRASRSTVA